MTQTKTFSKTPKQREAIDLLTSPALHTLLYGGARSGKSVILLYAMIVRGMKQKSRHVIFRRHFNNVKTSMWLETWVKMKDSKLAGVTVKEDRTNWFIELPPYKSEIWFAGLDEKDRTEKILGKEYSTIYFNECSEMDYSSVQDALARLAEKSGLALKAYYDENPPNSKHWTHLQFIEKLHPDTRDSLKHPEQYASLLMNPADNMDNLAANYISDILDNLPDRKRRRFRDGEFVDDVAGALWTADLISAYRVVAAPELVRVVVGGDPAVTSAATSDETGIIAAGKAANGHIYVLDDRSLLGTPLQWGRAVVGCYKDNKADRVIGEANNGGDLIEVNLRTIDRTISYKKVHASRGKMIRAEPVQAMYEQGMIHHVGQFPELEDEMCSYVPGVSTESPNRMDALVWACTELGVTSKEPSMVFA